MPLKATWYQLGSWNNLCLKDSILTWILHSHWLLALKRHTELTQRYVNYNCCESPRQCKACSCCVWHFFIVCLFFPNMKWRVEFSCCHFSLCLYFCWDRTHCIIALLHTLPQVRKRKNKQFVWYYVGYSLYWQMLPVSAF